MRTAHEVVVAIDVINVDEAGKEWLRMAAKFVVENAVKCTMDQAPKKE